MTFSYKSNRSVTNTQNANSNKNCRKFYSNLLLFMQKLTTRYPKLHFDSSETIGPKMWKIGLSLKLKLIYLQARKTELKFAVRSTFNKKKGGGNILQNVFERLEHLEHLRSSGLENHDI